MLKFISTVALVIISLFGGVSARATSLTQIKIGDWVTTNSELVERLTSIEPLSSMDESDLKEAQKGLTWVEDKFLTKDKEVQPQTSVDWHKPVNNVIPIYMAQYCDIPWWQSVTIIIEVVNLEEEFEVKMLTEYINCSFSVAFLYWQESANNKGYAYSDGVVSGNNSSETYSSFNIAPVVDYSNVKQPSLIGTYGKLSLPPSDIVRQIKMSIIIRPDMERVIPIHISNTNVRVKIFDGYLW